MNNDERICSIALTLCPGIGHIGAKRLIDGIGSAAGVFSQRKELPELLPGVSPTIVTALDNPAAFLRAEHEMEFVEKNRLTCLTLKDEAYPSRLRECEDAPIVLFFKGHTDFNCLRVINMVGTRNATEYGKQFCVDFLRDLSSHYPDVLVVSGLAYGIDIHAHRAALPTTFPPWLSLLTDWTVSILMFTVKLPLICWTTVDSLPNSSPKPILTGITLSVVTVLWQV